MKRVSTLLLLLLGISFPTLLQAQLQYIFTEESGKKLTGSFTNANFASRSTQTGATWGGSIVAGSAEVQTGIGFTFNFAGSNYTTVGISNYGVVALGGSVLNPLSFALDGSTGKLLAPFWDHTRVTDGTGGTCAASKVEYGTIGSAPNRIFVVSWNDMGLGQGGVGGLNAATFQLRIYETTNKIEFYYDGIDGSGESCSQWGTPAAQTTNAAIGIADDGDFLSVTIGSSTTVSSTKEAKTNVVDDPLNLGTVFSFCPGGVTGNPASGGTAAAADGDTLLVGEEVVVTASGDYKPLNIKNQCASIVSYSISGPSASEYAIVSANPGTLGTLTNTPTLRFSPTALGVRPAQLEVRDNTGQVVRTYNLAGEGIPRVRYIGIPAEGGTPDLLDGDTIFNGFNIENNTVMQYSPIEIRVANSPGPNAPVTYQLFDPTGTFTIDRTAESVPIGNSSIPVITVAPVNTVGPISARLIVNAEGDERTFVLSVFSNGAGARFEIAGQEIGAGAALFRNLYECVGVGRSSIAIDVTSIGDEPFEILSDRAFLTETEVRQGTPPYPLLRDGFGNPAPALDYFITDVNGDPLQFPITIAPGAVQTIFVTFLPTREGSRRARSFFATNGENFVGLDTDNNPDLGTLNFEFVGYGFGSAMSSPEKNGLPSAVVFPSTEVRGTSTMTGMIFNDGDCDLLVNADDFRITTGDVNEFELLTGLYNVQRNGTDYVIPPGDTAMFDVAFTPVRSGSRLASVLVESNDSSIYIQGITARGTHYIDLFGKGKVGLEGNDVMLAPAVIDGPSSTGTARLSNNFGGLVKVTGVVITGSTEIVEDPANPWPTIPFNVDPGTSIELGLQFTPDAAGGPGVRNAVLEVTLENGDVLNVNITALAGTRSVQVAPNTLFSGTNVPVGQIARRFFAINNNGTLPVRVNTINLTGAGAADYTVSSLARPVIGSGATEFIEVTFTPTAQGASDAMIEIVTNSTNGTPAGTHTVTLGGVGATTKFDDPSTGAAAIRPNVNAARMADGTVLEQSTPNPASSTATIRYRLPAERTISLELYDVNGRLVGTLEEGTFDGERTVSVDTRDLVPGRYYYMLRTTNGSLTLALDVVR